MTTFVWVTALAIIYVGAWVGELIFAPPHNRWQMIKEAVLILLLVMLFYTLTDCSGSVS